MRRNVGRPHEGVIQERCSAAGGHWQEIARQWKQVGPPLRPSEQDINFFKDMVMEWKLNHGAPRVLLLGVTPEIYHLPWPKGTVLGAVDSSQAMIDSAWPGPKEAVQCCDWLDLDIPEASRDIALCDGGLHLLAYPREQERLVEILHYAISDQGVFILRLYIPPSERESPEEVLQDLLEGRISNLNILKLRLGMALMDSAEEGIELEKIWTAVHKIDPDLESLAMKIGWPVDHVAGINAYKYSTSRYHFVTVDQVFSLFCGDPGGFQVHRICVPSYEMGLQCPTIIFRRTRVSVQKHKGR